VHRERLFRRDGALTLKRLGFDPATASSVFLTTATDVVRMRMLLAWRR